jgi:hypothetical protein
MKTNLTKKNFVFIALIFVSVILWAFFFSSLNLTLVELLNASKIKSVIAELNLENLILFLVFFPLTVALIVIQCKIEEHKSRSFIVSLGGTVTALIFSLIFFSNLQEYLLVGLFYVGGIALTVELIHVKKLELKKYVSLRLLGTGIHKTTILIAIGIFLLVSLTIYENQEFYSEQIDIQLLEIAAGNQTKEQLNEMVAEGLIESQKQTAEQVIALPSFQALKTSSDPNAVEFHSALLELKKYMDSPEYKQKIEEEINKQTSLSEEQLKEVLQSVKSQMPVFKLITDYLWLIEGFAFFSVFLLISSTIFYALTLIYGLIIEQILIRVF